MPNRLVLLELLPECSYVLCQAVKYDSYIICLNFPQDFFIGLGEDNSWSAIDLEFLEGFRAGFIGNEIILDILVISEYGYGALKVVLEFEGLLVVLGVKGEDQERAEIVEEGSCEDLVGLESLYLSHGIIIF